MDYYYKHPSTIEVEPDSKEEIDLMITQVLSKDFNSAVVDRTGNLNNFCVIKDPIPPMATETLDFNSIVDDRAKSVVDDALARGKEIKMEWNGSLPSTVILVSVHNYIDTLSIKPDVEVYVTLNAETRRDEIYKKYIVDSTIMTANHDGIAAMNKASKGAVNIVDDVGQKLFSVGYMEFVDSGTPFVDVCEPDLYSILKPVLDAKPDAWDDSVVTALHWINFTLSWQWSTIRRSIKSLLPPEDIIIFYNDVPFQQWFMQVQPMDKHPELVNKKSQVHCREYIKQYHYDETLDLCNFVTGRGYNCLSGDVKSFINPIIKGQRNTAKYCVGITANMDHMWQEKGKIAFEFAEAEAEGQEFKVLANGWAQVITG